MLLVSYRHQLKFIVGKTCLYSMEKAPIEIIVFGNVRKEIVKISSLQTHRISGDQNQYELRQ